MSSKDSKDQTEAAWDSLIYFRIYKDFAGESHSTARLFNNTRQQCAIRISIIAANEAGSPVQLSEADLRTIELIEYISNQPLPRSDDLANHQAYQYTSNQRDYVWDETIIAEAQDDAPDATTQMAVGPRQGAQTIQLFVSAKATSRLQIAARIPLPGGTAYISTNHVGFDDTDGTGGPNKLFNSSVLLQPATFPVLPASEYGEFASDGTLLPFDVGNRENFYWAKEHHIHVRFNGRLLPLKSVSATPTGSAGFAVYKQGSFFDDAKWGISYYGQPGATQPEHFPLPPLNKVEQYFASAPAREASAPSKRQNNIYFPLDMFKRCVGRIEGAASTRVVVGLIMGNLSVRFLNASGQQVPDKTNAVLHIVDEYGNAHALSLTFGTRANQLRLSAARAHTNDEIGSPISPKPRVGDWFLQRMNASIEQTRLYRNGRQQATVRLYVEAELDGVLVKLTEQERQNIRLFNYYEEDKMLPFTDDGSSSSYKGWSAQRRHRGYEPHPLATGTDARQGPGETLTFHVSADDLAAELNTLTLAFAVKGDDGSTWRSNGWITRPTGDRYFAAAFNNGSLTVTSEPPRQYTAESFRLDRRPLANTSATRSKAEESAAPIFDDIVTLSIAEPGGQLVNIRQMTCAPAGMIHWINNLPVTSNPCFTGYASPGESQVHWNPEVPKGSRPLPTLSSPDAAKGMILLCGRIDIPRADHANPPRGPMTVNLIDAYGSSQTCRIVFVEGTRDELDVR
ncbi:hypothetical protein [Luteibacter sp. UNCMF366Tsu5.1]|uniref:hypothetical protein n=1 Tax=Luteibacter sp. UNCMF366Tsu5.1 TaxID=1502758 RepID=UPI0009086541|nr:hypothetical protein [Luteibacter sp. UNCMF366Tsu5.1]SFW34644.1 hypothetical protein SAMN02800691_1221 [Luteibacter sp. UNCMF366Tsu5.1]